MKCPICGYETTESENACTRCAGFREFYGDAVDNAPPPGQFVELEPISKGLYASPRKWGPYIAIGMIALLCCSVWGILRYSQDQMIDAAIFWVVSTQCADNAAGHNQDRQDTYNKRWQDALSASEPQIEYHGMNHATVTFVRDGKVIATTQMVRPDVYWTLDERPSASQ